MSRERVIVTGGQGYVGRYVVAELLSAGAIVHAVGRSPRNDLNFTHAIETSRGIVPAPMLPETASVIAHSSVFSYASVDLTNEDAVHTLIDSYRPERIIHLAGALRDESSARLNESLLATTIVCKAAAGAAIPPVVIIGSSGAVYGSPCALPLKEDARCQPVGPYAQSKYKAEIAAQEIAHHHKLQIGIARIFNIIGPGLQQRHFAGKLAHAIAEAEAIGRGEIVLGDLSSTRDFIDVRDVAGFLAGWRQPANLILNVASGVEVLMSDLCQTFLAEITVPLAFHIDRRLDRLGADRVVADAGALQKQFSLQLDLSQSLRAMLTYARKLFDGQHT